MIGAFVQSAGILLREGLEAMLVIAALAAYLDKVGSRHRVGALYAGAGIAIIASVVAALLFEVFNNGVHSDVIEGVIILFAAALMLYVSGWLLLRQNPRAWQNFLKRRAEEALAKETTFAVAFLAFFAVFREGAETVLFIHALAQTEGGWSLALIGGLSAAACALAILFFVINIVARRLPLRPVFIATSAFLFAMAIVFVGQAIQEFQEQQLISYTEFRESKLLSAIGLNPTLEAVSVQVMVLLFAVATFLILEYRARSVARSGVTAARPDHRS